MSIFRYAVVFMGREWRILSNRRSFGHFRSSESARAIAESLAREAVDEGHAAELLVQEPFGKLEPAPVPPRPQLPLG
jgi:hypothetical protein